MQGLGMNEEQIYSVEKEIIEFCKNEEVKCMKVSGPSYEHPLNENKAFLSDAL
jgi:hypothetical protein